MTVLKFNLGCVNPLGLTTKVMSKGVLYKLRSRHPTIDGVGLLKDEANVDWLVFIQISIKPYKLHSSKISKIFQQPKSEQATSQELKKETKTLYAYYKKLAGIPSSDKINVILIYISPEEICDQNKTTLILPDLCQEVSDLQKELKEKINSMYVGIMSRNSEFYPKLIEQQ